MDAKLRFRSGRDWEAGSNPAAPATDEPGGGWSLSRRAGAPSVSTFVGVVVVTRCPSERAPHLLCDARTFFCSVQGALHSVLFLAGSLRLQMGKLGRPEAKVTPRLPVLPPAPITSICRR